MNQSSSSFPAPVTAASGNPKDLDITVFDDGRWRHAASYPDRMGGYREAYFRRLDGGGWALRVNEHVGSEEFQGETDARWKDGLAIDRIGSEIMSYEMARGVAEAWIRDGRIFEVA